MRSDDDGSRSEQEQLLEKWRCGIGVAEYKSETMLLSPANTASSPHRDESVLYYDGDQ